MGNYKINSSSDNGVFVVTDAYKKLNNKFSTVKNSKGRIIHVIGAPGTGKSANIYHALNGMNLNVYDVEFRIKDMDADSSKVFMEMYNHLKRDLSVHSKDEIYESFARHDAILFADRFHDSHLMEDGTVGFSLWTDHNGLKSFRFYLLCMFEYFKNRKKFKKINIILQTAWRIRFKGKKYDLFTDLGFVSKIMVAFMKIFFEVVEISYTPEETIQIVKKHVNADENEIRNYMEMYGNKPRLICQAIDKECV